MNSLRCTKMFLLAVCLHFACAPTFAQDKSVGVDNGRTIRSQALRGMFGTYSHPPLLPNGRVEVQKLVDELIDIHANTYCFAIHGNTNQWDDLQLFLPLARKAGIRVWSSVVPPSESPPRAHAYAEPFRLDYDRWAVEFAKLSLRETNLVAWSIDDFTHNLNIFTPEQVKKMLDASRKVNPRFAFVPCCYYKSITPEFVKNYKPLLDGFLFPYRHESGGANLKDADLVVPELHKIKEMTGRDFPVILDIYATRHSKLGDSTPDYVEQVMLAGKPVADGIMIYCHQDPKTSEQKYQVIKRVFGSWTK